MELGVKYREEVQTIERKVLEKVEMPYAIELPEEYCAVEHPYCYRVLYGGLKEAIYIKKSESCFKFILIGEEITDEDLEVIEKCKERLKKINEKINEKIRKSRASNMNRLFEAFQKAFRVGKVALDEFSSDELEEAFDDLIKEGIIREVTMNSFYIGTEYRNKLFKVLPDLKGDKKILYCLGQIWGIPFNE